MTGWAVLAAYWQRDLARARFLRLAWTLITLIVRYCEVCVISAARKPAI